MERRGDKDTILFEEQTIMSGECMAHRPIWLGKLRNCGLGYGAVAKGHLKIVSRGLWSLWTLTSDFLKRRWSSLWKIWTVDRVFLNICVVLFSGRESWNCKPLVAIGQQELWELLDQQHVGPAVRHIGHIWRHPPEVLREHENQNSEDRMLLRLAP